MRNRQTLFGAILVNLTFLATDVLACSMCITALADSILPPIFLWVLIATTWFISNAVVSSAAGITLKWYPTLVLSIAIVVILFCLAGGFFGMGVMLVMFVPAAAAFVQSLSPGLRKDIPDSKKIFWIGIFHLIGVAVASVLMIHTHLTRTPEKFIIQWDGTSIASIKFDELKAKGPQALAALRYIKENGGKGLAAEAAESIKEIEELQKAVSQIDQTTEKKVNSIGMKFVRIQPGTFIMGMPPDKSGNNLFPEHKVTLTKDFYMQTTEVTQGQWKTIMGGNPSKFQKCGDNCPVENVSWYSVQEFIKKLNQKEGGNRYRLPTEAEWEYACRAGTNTLFSFGDNEDQFGSYAWYGHNSNSQTQPVATKRPNAWGLYDMYGNVSEWCQDWDAPSLTESIVDPTGPLSGEYKISRGSIWFFGFPEECRCGFSRGLPPGDGDHTSISYTGFRLVMTSSDNTGGIQPAVSVPVQNKEDKNKVSQADGKIDVHKKELLSEKGKDVNTISEAALEILTKKVITDSAKAIARDGRFIAYDNGTVLDTRTNLMWASKDNGSDINWANARSYCENYRSGGYPDWRMPTQDELAGLYDSNKSYKAKQRDYSVHLTELIQLSACCPWASETRGSDAAIFLFNNGFHYWHPQSNAFSRALPVRSGK